MKQDDRIDDSVSRAELVELPLSLISTPLIPSAYAGIGSRITPPIILKTITELAVVLARCGLTLRSGGAPGADSAFEEGCDEVNGRKEIFLPWKDFNKNASKLFPPPPKALALAKALHPHWGRCHPASRKLHARNCQQVLGENLSEPISFVLFWAPEIEGFVQGGSATAINLARTLKIPTFNLWLPETRESWEILLKRLNGYPAHLKEKDLTDRIPASCAP